MISIETSRSCLDKKELVQIWLVWVQIHAIPNRNSWLLQSAFASRDGRSSTTKTIFYCTVLSKQETWLTGNPEPDQETRQPECRNAEMPKWQKHNQITAYFSLLLDLFGARRRQSCCQNSLPMPLFPSSIFHSFRILWSRCCKIAR